MSDPTSFSLSSPDRLRKPDNPYVGYDLIKGTYSNTDSLAADGGGHFVNAFQVNLSKLNLDLIIPEVEIYYHYDTSLGGGISKRSYIKLPFSRLNSSGTVEEQAYFDISFQYDNTKGTTPLTGTTFLSINYFNRSSSSGGQSFDYKIKSSRAQTISTAGLGL